MTFQISRGLENFQNKTLPTRNIVAMVKASKMAPRRAAAKAKSAPAPKSKR